MFYPAHGLSVWLGLPSIEQLMSSDCLKHQVLSLAKVLVVKKQKIIVLISVLQSGHIYKSTLESFKIIF